MTRFVALLRGITPSNPAMSNQNLRTVCEGIGLTNVATVISSGNVVFDAADEPAYLESKLEAAWKSELGFESTTLLRSRGDLEDLVSMRPFGDLEHGPDSYLLVSRPTGPPGWWWRRTERSLRCPTPQPGKRPT
jgi:uncharacterized protein (DUF1697 family)